MRCPWWTRTTTSRTKICCPAIRRKGTNFPICQRTTSLYLDANIVPKNTKRFCWHGWRDSNPHQRFWRPACYHCTTPILRGICRNRTYVKAFAEPRLTTRPKCQIKKKLRVFRVSCNIINTSESPDTFSTVSGTKIILYSFTHFFLVGMGGLEPPTLRVSDECSNQLSYIPICGTPRRSRTLNLLIRSQVLYPIELSVQVVLCTGVEPVFHPWKGRVLTIRRTEPIAGHA